MRKEKKGKRENDGIETERRNMDMVLTEKGGGDMTRMDENNQKHKENARNTKTKACAARS